jgi:hypothetical protein
VLGRAPLDPTYTEAGGSNETARSRDTMKQAQVTGATSGIGRAIAHALRDSGPWKSSGCFALVVRQQEYPDRAREAGAGAGGIDARYQPGHRHPLFGRHFLEGVPERPLQRNGGAVTGHRE